MANRFLDDAAVTSSALLNATQRQTDGMAKLATQAALTRIQAAAKAKLDGVDKIA